MEKINKKELKQIFNQMKESEIKEKAIEELYNKYNKIIYAIAFSILKNKEDSEDVAQNVMIKIYNIDKEKLPTDNEATWLYAVTKNEAVGVIRKKYKEIDLENLYEIEDGNNEIEKVIDTDSFNRLLGILNDKEKEIVLLKVLSNFSFKQIEALLGESGNTIKWRYYKSIYKIKMLLSNLSLFILTFTLGILTIKKSNKKSNQAIQDIENKEENYINETSSPTLDKTEQDAIIKEDIEKVEIDKNNVIQETIAEDIQTTNYLGIGILNISAIFLVVTIITLIFFKKYQLKLKVKSSK